MIIGPMIAGTNTPLFDILSDGVQPRRIPMAFSLALDKFGTLLSHYYLAIVWHGAQPYTPASLMKVGEHSDHIRRTSHDTCVGANANRPTRSRARLITQNCTVPVMKSSYFTNYTPFVHEYIPGFMKYERLRIWYQTS